MSLLTERGPRMADTSQHELSEPHTNGAIDGLTEEEKSKMRPADIDADMREMERRKRVEIIMNSKMFKEELERIIETQLKDGSGPSGLLQQISDMMGAQGARFNANVFKNSSCVVPINDIRGVEAKGYERGEKLLRCKLAAVFRLLDLYGWTQGVGGQITARLNAAEEHFLVNPFGLLYHEVTASSLVKVDMQGQVVEQGTTNFGVHVAEFQLHSTIHAARPDIKCIIHITTPTVTAVSSLKSGLLPIGPESIVIGDVSTHQYIGDIIEPEEREKITRNLGPINKVMLLTNRGAVCCGDTIEEAFYNVYNTVLACETQLKLMPMGLENLSLLSEESRKSIYEASRKPPIPHMISSVIEPSPLAEKLEKRWRIGGTEFEALMRMLDNAGFRTGYIYRHPLIKSEPPRPRNDVEVPPAVSSLGYLFEEEELYKQGLWKGGRKGADRSRWLNSPNVYQKVEILETGTPDPKKITKWVDQNAEEWVSDGSPTHSSSTPVRIESALQFVPKNTNPKEFKQLQQQIKDYRRADKISAGPQSHILEGVSWEEAKKMQDATISGTGEQVVLVGAASKGIIQRNFQHNAMVYKTPYAKNPFDAVTDQELDQYKKDVERKTKGDIYDESQSESEALSSFNISRATHESSTAKSPIQSPISVTSETEEESRDEPRVLRIETKRVPKPSQAEVVLSDGKMHEHENDADKSNSSAVTVSNSQIKSVTTQSHIVPLNRQKIEVDATTEFINQMRRSAIEPMNNRNKRDYDEATSNDEGSEEIPVGKYGHWCLSSHEELHLERTKILTLTPLKSLKQSKSLNNLNRPASPTFKEKSNYSNLNSRIKSYRRRIFFDQYDKIYAQYKNSNLTSNNNFNLNDIDKSQGLVKQLVAKYSNPSLFDSNINNNNNNRLVKSRKRSYQPPVTSCSVCKIPRLSLPTSLNLHDLQSPRLVEAVMSQEVRKTQSETSLPTESRLLSCEVRSLPTDPKLSPINMSLFHHYGELKYESTALTDVQVSQALLPTAGNFEFVDTGAIKSEPDVNGNPQCMVSSGEKINSDQEVSSEDIASMQTVIENKTDDKKEAKTEVESISPELIDNLEWLNEPLDTLESSFAKELNDSQPWRFSSPLASGKKSYQREDSMTEVIDSININLTPSKTIRSLDYRLPETDVSIKYNLNSTHMSMIYSLTPTTEIEDGEEGNEHINCGKACPQCLILGPMGSLSPTDHDSFYIWDEPIVEDNQGEEEEEEKDKENVIDLNKTIDLFDNSIETECNVSAADLELPVKAEVEEDDGEFHKDIEITVNEIIEGLGEREALIKATDLVDDVLNFACKNVGAVVGSLETSGVAGYEEEGVGNVDDNEAEGERDDKEDDSVGKEGGVCEECREVEVKIDDKDREDKEEVNSADRGTVSEEIAGEEEMNSGDRETVSEEILGEEEMISSAKGEDFNAERIVVKEEINSMEEIEDDAMEDAMEDAGVDVETKEIEEEVNAASGNECNIETNVETFNDKEEMHEINTDDDKEEICEIIHKISFNENTEENVSDKYLVVDELIHHIIDKDTSSSSEHTPERQDSHESREYQDQEESPRDTSESSESFNLKKVKENTNIEIKEMQSLQGSTPDLAVQDKVAGSKEDFLTKLKVLIDDLNPDEGEIKEEFTSVINNLHLNCNELSPVESNDILQQLKCIVEQSDSGVHEESFKASDTLEVSTCDSSSSLNRSEVLRQFKNRFEEIFKRSQASLVDVNDNINNIDSTEFSSLEVNMLANDHDNAEDINASGSVDVEEEYEREETSIDDTKSDNSKEKIEINSKAVKFCIIEYEGEGNEVQDEKNEGQEETGTQENMIENISDGEKEALRLWEMAESEMERSYNHVRSSESEDTSLTFRAYEPVDDVIDTINLKPLAHYQTRHDLHLDSLDDVPKVPSIGSKEVIALSTISEDEEVDTDDSDIIVDYISSPTRNINNNILKADKVDSICSLESITEIDETEDTEILSIVQMNEDINNILNEDADDSTEVLSIKNIFNEDWDNSVEVIYVNNSRNYDINVIDTEKNLEKSLINSEMNVSSSNNFFTDSVNELKLTSSSLTEFYSCQDELSTNRDSFETCFTSQKSSVQAITPRSIEDDSSKYSTVNSETYTISDNDNCDADNDDCLSEINEIPRDTMYNADVSGNLRKSDSFSEMNFNACDTTVNMADLSSFNDSDKSDINIINRERNINTREEMHEKKTDIEVDINREACNGCGDINISKKSDTEEDINNNSDIINGQVIDDYQDINSDSTEKICSVCSKYFSVNDLKNITIDDFCDSLIIDESTMEWKLQKNDTCRNCLMTMSMDTRDFIRLERQVVHEENIKCNLTLNMSPLKSPPKYEDTTLCKVVSKITFTDSNYSRDSNISQDSLVDS
ncbi:uncharacterized protein LOC130672189 isoform X4 [Microplitis mediator]|uniref:uncharacterized protein LOC130672189 isoform X4 n=1 Tax=Microplitis mediator TaxID=375433 RepID=UPI00255246DE|nr:uncharacterized protein LOC130672189 isoform X4 [Microplitis mediator]